MAKELIMVFICFAAIGLTGIVLANIKSRKIEIYWLIILRMQRVFKQQYYDLEETGLDCVDGLDYYANNNLRKIIDDAKQE